MREIKLDIACPKFEILYKSKELGLRHIVISSGRGTGKSWGVSDFINYATHEYRTRVFCARTVQNSLSQSSWKSIKDSAIRMGVYDDYEWVESKGIIRCPSTGSEIYFGGIDNDPQKFKSTEGIDIFWYEEAQTASQESIDIILPTIRKAGALLIWTVNPRFENDPFSRTFLTCDVKRDDTAVVKLLPEDNRFFPEVLRVEMEYCRKTDPDAYSHIWLGEFASTSSESLIPMDSIRVCVGKPVERQPYLIYAGLDVGATGDPTACYIRRGREYIAHTSWQEADHHVLVDKVCEYLDRYNVALVMPDSTGFGYTFAQMLSKRYGESRVIPVNFAQSANKQGFANKRAEMALSVRDAVVSGISLPVDNELIEELGTVKAWRTSSDKWQIEPKGDIRHRLGRSTNWLDAIMLSYAVADRPENTQNNDMSRVNRIIFNSMGKWN